MKWYTTIFFSAILASLNGNGLATNISAYGNSSDEDGEGTNSSGWTTKSKRSEMAYITVAIGITGAIGNSVVLVVMALSNQLRVKTTNKLIMHQCFIDTMCGLVLCFNTLFDDIKAIPLGLSSDIFCTLWISEYFQWAFMFTSTANLVFLTFEKYLSVFHFKLHGILFTKYRFIIPFLATWLYGFCLHSYNILAYRFEIKSKKCLMEYNFDSTSVAIVVAVLNVWLPLVIFTFCHGRIVYYFHYVMNKPEEKFRTAATIKAMKNITFLTVNVADPRVNEDPDYWDPSILYLARNNSIRTLIVVAFGFLICWVPNNIYYTVHITTRGAFTSMTSIVYNVTKLLVFCNTLINPKIYVIVYKDFQKGVKKLFCPPAKREEPITVMTFDVTQI